jgi:hypothetical protein
MKVDLTRLEALRRARQIARSTSLGLSYVDEVKRTQIRGSRS